MIDILKLNYDAILLRKLPPHHLVTSWRLCYHILMTLL